MILRRRKQLLTWLEDNAPTASIRRAVGEGEVEYLGFFSSLIGSRFPGWVTRVVSPITGVQWYVVVRKDTHQQWYRTWIFENHVPWEFWNPTDSKNPFFYGDNPGVYTEKREDAKAKRRGEVHQEDDKP